MTGNPNQHLGIEAPGAKGSGRRTTHWFVGRTGWGGPPPQGV